MQWLKGAALALALAPTPAPGETAAGCIPPPNGDCDGAIVFSSADLPFETTQTGTHLVHMCNSEGDTYLRIYRNGCGWTTGVELATADDECPGSPPNADPLIAIELAAGESYWFELGTWRPEPPWAPPPNSPYYFSISLPDQQTPVSCDRTGLATVLVGGVGNAADANGMPTTTVRRTTGSTPRGRMSSPAGFGLAINMASEAANVGFRVAAAVYLGDLDGDNDIDQGDRAAFEACFTGSDAGPVDPLCAIGDFDADSDVDCDD